MVTSSTLQGRVRSILACCVTALFTLFFLHHYHRGWGVGTRNLLTVYGDADDPVTLARVLFGYIENPHGPCKKLEMYGGVDKGRYFDGDKFICLDQRFTPPVNNCLIYSFGIGYEWSFEQKIVESCGCEVIGFDPYMSYPEDGSTTDFGARFYQTGLAGTERTDPDTGADLAPLAQLRRDLGHVTRPIHYLKIDIEGAEWEWLENEQIDTLKSVWQIGMEVHLDNDIVKSANTTQFHRYIRLLSRLEDVGFRLAHSHANRASDRQITIPGYQALVGPNYELVWVNVGV